ncbi:MAG: OmpA family protein [Treponema sp.]|nr:OmpA family protein [Treponema sp.]
MKRNLFSASVFILSSFLFAGEPDQIVYSGGKNYSYIERTDLRRYDNGKYTGLVSREVRSFIAISNTDDNYVYYDGIFFIDESTKRNTAEVKDGINEAIPSSFKISSDGNLSMLEDNGYPSFRSFPSYANGKIKPGDKWTSKAVRAVDPLNKGVITKIPFYVEYEYLRDEVYNGEDVFVLSARWATRYGAKFYLDFGGDGELVEASGSHRATIYVEKRTGVALVIRDTVDETFKYSDGNTVTFKGGISCFTKYPPALEKDEIIATINRVAFVEKQNEIKDIEYDPVASGSGGVASQIALADDGNNSSPADGSGNEAVRTDDQTGDDEGLGTWEETPAGIMLTVKNLQFKPDSSELLPGQDEKISQIAEVLKTARESMFLIEGHTASTGNLTGEMELSKERAKVIAEMLSQRGIESSRFIVKGSGSSKPVADNSTKEGMAKNRRVEITILE